MFCKVPYTAIGGKHRPYLEVIFSNKLLNKDSNKTLAMVDSGADHTVIPYSIGVLIGLTEPTESEKLASVSGVGGNLSYIVRKCQINVINKQKNEIYGFDETVWWIYPDAETQKQQNDLIKKFQDLQKLQNQCFPNTELHSHFNVQMQQTIQDITKIGNRLETSVLLGRPFFDNFEFIQFFHKDRNKEDKCFFNYKTIESKIVETLPINSDSPLLNQVQARRKKI